MKSEKIKHGGCYGCGDKGQKILKSITSSKKGHSIALCDKCFGEANKNDN